MTTRKSLAFSLAALAIAVPGIATASSLYHSSNGEIGYTTHPEHLQSSVSREEVIRELEKARQDGSLGLMSRGTPLPIKSAGPSKTRAQVQQELRDMSDAEKSSLKEMYGAGG